MCHHNGVALRLIVGALACMSGFAHAGDVQSMAVPPPAEATAAPAQGSLPDQDFTHPPEKPHDPADFFFHFDQMDHYYRVPGELTHRLTGDQYGFEALSFIITETYPGGGPGLHVHDTEEAHVLLEGSAQYRIGDKTLTVQAPYVARVPAGVPHTFINVGTMPFNLVAVFASKHPNTKRIGPNPLIPAQRDQEVPRPVPGAPAQEIAELERVWNEAHLNGDAEALERLWAEDMTLSVPGMPTFSKADALAMWRSSRVRFTRYETSDTRIRVHGDSAVATGRLRRSRDFGGRVAEEDWQFTKTYARNAGRWQVVAFHASTTPSP